LIDTANSFACSNLKPDLTLFLDVSVEVSNSRMRKRELQTNTSADRIERAGDSFHNRLRRGFLEMAEAEPERIVKIDASASVDEVWENVWKQVRRFL
jgi:dTMP kinase